MGGTVLYSSGYLGLCSWRENHSLPLPWGCCPHWATAPSTGPPPQVAPHTCATGPAGISLTTPPSWIPVTVCQFSTQCICTLLIAIQLMAVLNSVHLHSALMLIISFLLIAHCYPAHCSCICIRSKHLLAVHQEQLLLLHKSLDVAGCLCCSDTLHKQLTMAAVPPTCGDTTWVITAGTYRRIRALRVLSLMYMCSIR
jgi:hypothetical protein